MDKMYAELKRTCESCNTTKLIDEFYKNNLHKDKRCKICISVSRKKHYANNREKRIDQVAKYRADNPEKIRDTKLRQAYGIGVDWYERQFEKQNGVCATCKRPESTIWRGRVLSLAVDHDHESHEPRGLLCMRCNRAFGLLEENRNTILALLDYIDNFKK